MNTTYINKPDILKWYIYKILLIMRLTTVILLVSILQVSASTVAQEFTYVKKGASLIQIFKEVKKQTGYNIIWNEKKIDVTTTIDANFKKATIHDVMEEALSGFPLTFVINEKTIVIQAKEKYRVYGITEVIKNVFATIDVRGRVVDENNAPLVGATVKVKGTRKSTRTNTEGQFFLQDVDERAVLEVSFIGYVSQEIKASGNIEAIKMVIADRKLEEVKINAGYYTVNDRERTGNISRITSKDIEKQPVNNALMALSGNVPGLQVVQSSGVPGGGFTVRVRGQNSILSGNDPLYIVDGVIYPSTDISSSQGLGGINNILGTGGANPLGFINPNDIESIEVLKDADATAIYGSRGANGVILIFTKKANKDLKNINASISQGFSEVGKKADLLNTEQYLQMRREAYFTNDGLTTSSFEYESQYDINGTWEETKYTDWQEKLIGGTAHLTNASMTLGGGNDKSNYLIAGSYSSEGVVVPGDFGVKRAGIRSNINLGAPADRFQATLTLNLNHNTSNLYSNSLMGAVFLPPNQPDPYDQYGQLNWANNTVVSNPMANLLNTSNTQTDNLIANLILSYKVLNNLVLKTSLGYSTIRRKEFRKAPLAAWAPLYGFTSTFRNSYFGNNYNNNFIAEPQLNYQAKIGSGKIDALMGISIQENNGQINVIRARNFTSDDLLENIASAATITNDQNDFIQYRYFAVFSRFNYSMKQKYFVNITARRDGSSRFGPGKQFANFGAVGLGWNFSEESIIKNALPFLSFGKLRGSYGVTGNDQILNYQYLQLWSAGVNYQGNSTLTPSNSAKNPLFKWETNHKLEGAVQLSFFKSKVNFDVSWFRNRSSDQLLYQQLSLSTGQSGSYVNLPAKIRNSGWEFDSSVDVLSRKNLSWSTRFNITIPKNKLLAYDGLESSGNAVNYQIGKPLSILKAYSVNVDGQTGIYMLEDINGNGVPDDSERNRVRFIGQSLYGGLSNSLKFKQFVIDFLFTFSKQNGKSYLSDMVMPGSYSLGAFSNQYIEVLNRWQQIGDDKSIAKYSTTFANDNLYYYASQFGDNSIVDASYVRLRNVSLGYNLPKQLLSSIKVTSASIHLQGQNLITWTNYVGFDPETQGINLPPLRTVLLSLNVTF